MADTKVGTKTGKSTPAGRDVYKTEDGENVSEKSVTFKYKGQWINVPSIHEGYQYDDDTLRMMLDSEVIKPTSTHKSESDAVKAAIKRSKSLKFNEGGDVAAQTEAAFNTRRQDRRQDQRNAQQNAREVNAGLESKENTDTPSHPLDTVPFFSRPMGSSTDDRQVGIDDGGNPVFQGRLGNYTVQRADDQRTFRSKVEQDVLPAVKEYLNNPTAPTAEQTVNFAKQIAGDAWETISIPGDLLSGEKSGADVTLGEIFEMVPAMAAASTAFKVPGGEDTLRIFGGPGAKSYYNRDFYKAQDLLTKGQTPEQVEAATGRFDSARTGDYIGSPISLDKDYQDIKDKKDYLEGQLAREDLTPDLRQEYESAQTTLNLELADIEAKYPSGVSEPENPLKFEIDDSQVEIRSNDGSQTLKESTKQYPIAVGNIIPTHTELFKEYPDLADVNFYVDPSSSSTSAFFNPLVGNNGAIVVGSSRAASNPNSNFFRNGFFHELQHAAQYQDYKVEGLNQLGGSPTSIGQNLVRGKIPVQKTLEKNKKLVSVRDELLDLFDKSSDVRDPKVAKDLARKMREMESELFKTYMRSASEVEARVVGKRGEVLGDRAENSVSSQVPLERQIETLSEFQEDMPKSPSGKIKEDIKIKLGPMTEDEIKRYSEGAVNFARYAKGVDDKLQGFGDFADPKRMAKSNFNEGGAVVDRQAAVNNQMEMAFGDEVEQIDAVSGNEVPPGSTPKEVRDDIPVMLSEGEYVIPADVTRYYGVKFFEDLRNQAKIDLAAMEQNGRIGGEPIPEDDELTDDEMAILQEVMMSEQETAGMFQGGMATPTQIPSVSQVTQPTEMTLKSQLKLPTYSRGMAEGGDSKKLDPFGNPIRQVPSDPAGTMPSLLADTTDNSSSGIYGLETSEDDAPTTGRYRYTRTTSSDTTGVDSGMKTVFYIHKDGRRLPVLTLNGKPLGGVPADFADFLADTPENRTKLNFGSSEEEEEETTEDTANTTGTNEGEGEGSNYGVDDIQTSPDINTPEGVEASYSGTGVSVSDPVGAAKDALGSTTSVSKGLGGFATAISPGLGVLAGGVGVASSLSAVSTANANKSMAEFLGKTDEAKEIQDSIDDFLSKSPNAVSSLDSIVASGDSKFNEALEAAFNVNAPEPIYTDELTATGKINVEEYLSENAPKAPTLSDKPVARTDVTPTTTSSTPTSTPTGLYSGITGKSFSDTALGGFLGLGDKDNDNENDNDSGGPSGGPSGGTSGDSPSFGGGER